MADDSVSDGTVSSGGSAGPKKRYKRKLSNFLLDRSFQLKYAGFLFGVAAVLSAGLGYLLWTTNTARSWHGPWSAYRGVSQVCATLCHPSPPVKRC